MRSGTNCTINSGQVHSWSLELLLNAKLVKDHGWKCSAAIVLGITLRRRPLHFHQRRLPRFGQGTVRSGRADRVGGRLAQNAACLGTAVERRLDRSAAATHAPPRMGRGSGSIKASFNRRSKTGSVLGKPSSNAVSTA